MRVSNAYFLISAVICSIKVFSPVPAFTSIVPLGFVLACSLLREAYEDIVIKYLIQLNLPLIEA
jgi:hypothetical protein